MPEPYTPFLIVREILLLIMTSHLERLEVLTNRGDENCAYRTPLGWQVVGTLAVESSLDLQDRVHGQSKLLKACQNY